MQGRDAEIWVTGRTAESDVQSCLTACRALGYHVVIYRSGTGDLATLTGDLLQHNTGLGR